MIKLKEFRKNLGLTQQEMCNVIGKEGGFECFPSYIGGLECGSKNPSFAFLKAFKKAYPYVSIDEIFFS